MKREKTCGTACQRQEKKQIAKSVGIIRSTMDRPSDRMIRKPCAGRDKNTRLSFSISNILSVLGGLRTKERISPGWSYQLALKSRAQRLEM